MSSSVSSISSCRPRAQPATTSGLQGLAYDLKACIPAKPAYLRAAECRSPLGLLRLCLTVAAWLTGHVVRKLTFHAWGMHARVREDQALARFGLTDVSFMHEPHGLSAILDQEPPRVEVGVEARRARGRARPRRGAPDPWASRGAARRRLRPRRPISTRPACPTTWRRPGATRPSRCRPAAAGRRTRRG